MSSVHAQIYVRDNVLRVESRLPHRFSAEGLELDIAPAVRRERLVGELCSIRHDARWTLGSASGPAVVDLVRSGSQLTELIVQTTAEGHARRRSEDHRRDVLRRLVVALRSALAVDAQVAEPEPAPPRSDEPWRTPA
jgi:hypothetical protein